MSVVASYRAKCDVCKRLFGGMSADTAREARVDARRSGWKRIGYADHCPTCRADAELRTAAERREDRR